MCPSPVKAWDHFKLDGLGVVPPVTAVGSAALPGCVFAISPVPAFMGSAAPSSSPPERALLPAMGQRTSAKANG